MPAPPALSRPVSTAPLPLQAHRSKSSASALHSLWKTSRVLGGGARTEQQQQRLRHANAGTEAGAGMSAMDIFAHWILDLDDDASHASLSLRSSRRQIYMNFEVHILWKWRTDLETTCIIETNIHPKAPPMGEAP